MHSLGRSRARSSPICHGVGEDEHQHTTRKDHQHDRCGRCSQTVGHAFRVFTTRLDDGVGHRREAVALYVVAFCDRQRGQLPGTQMFRAVVVVFRQMFDPTTRGLRADGTAEQQRQQQHFSPLLCFSQRVADDVQRSDVLED